MVRTRTNDSFQVYSLYSVAKLKLLHSSKQIHIFFAGIYTTSILPICCSSCLKTPSASSEYTGSIRGRLLDEDGRCSLGGKEKAHVNIQSTPLLGSTYAGQLSQATHCLERSSIEYWRSILLDLHSTCTRNVMRSLRHFCYYF